ncbi:Ig-like domain-containing protein [Thalassotalea atypica]|uniref:Ig-like domain-containing protein n=1 Tax=Thalassotalea atypica TaxID=2054316 RepID=UPI002573FD79|nr:Ig-like domain-containing protein [Thalassotalea atypica]
MQLLRRLSITMLLLILAGCGGGDGSLSDGNTPVTPDPVDEPITIELTLSSDSVSEQTPVTITALVMQDGAVVAGKLVSFAINDPDTTSDNKLAFFNPENGAASTNSEGIATITLLAGGKSGGGEIVASVDGGTVTSGAAGFNSAGDGATDDAPKVATISLFASTQQMASSGAQEISLTAIIKDNNNNLVEGASVAFDATSGQIQVTKSLTEADGQATAVLRTDNEPSNRVITVTTTSDQKTDVVNIEVIGTSVQLSGSTSLAINDENNYIVKVLDSDGEGIPETLVNLSLDSASGNNITIPSSVTTDFTGQATFAATGTSSGNNTINATALGATGTQAVSIQADSFLFSTFTSDGLITPISDGANIPDVFLSDSATITLEWLRSGQPVPDGTKVTFTTTRGDVSVVEASTVNGIVSVDVSSSNAGKALVTFTGSDGDVELNNQLSFEFVAETAATLVAQASPSSIGPNEQSSVISVVVKDVNGNLVKNKIIDFKLEDTSGGEITVPADTTDSNGAASTVYKSNTVSAKNGVVITATVRDEPGVFDTVELTVAERELFISLGTGNTIVELDETTYSKTYSVFVTDVDSRPRQNITLQVSAIPHNFKKGQWVKVFDEGEFQSWAADVSITCPNEDVNQDGILDFGEDTNGDGILTPGNIVSVTGVEAANFEIITDSQGRAVIDLLYPQSYAQWSDIDIIVSAKVTGTENIEKTIFTLPVNSDDVTKEDVIPPVQSIGLQSPFGLTASCNSAN